ncbi:RagB/SusD family nutrient uptake outer membrane protein [Viscerimonas tarda]
MKQIIHILVCILLVSGASSCTDWLGLEPEDGVIREKFWKTKEEAQSALMGCYASMMEDDVMLRYFIWGEMRAEFVAPSSRASATIIAIRDGEIVSTNEYAEWEYFYKTINQCNTVIELAPLAKEKDVSFSQNLLNQYTAEAVCIRSLAYFYLLRTFRDVPYVVKASIYDDQDYSRPKMPQAEILGHLVADLLSVEEYLPFTYSDNISSKGRFTRWGLKALLADIYLWKGDYAACRDLCTQIIDSEQFSLIPVKRDESSAMNINGEIVPVYFADKNDISVLFDKMYVQGNSVESIFELQFGADKGNPFVKWHKPVSGLLVAKTSEINTFFPRSSLDREYYDIRPEFAWKQESVWKWIGLSATGATFRADNASFSNWIFYRLADIILMKAEALTQLAMADNNNQAQLEEALDLVQRVRTRANATEASDLEKLAGEDIDSKSMEEFILHERARELAFEGKRWFDVLRHVERDNYRNLPYLIQLAIRSTQPEKVSILQNKWENHPGSHYMPIYEAEISMNKNLEQNEYYK